MKPWITRVGVIGVCAAVGAIAYAADHKDSPSVSADAKTDITDVYTFTDGTNIVFVMDVNGFSGPIASNDFRFSLAANYKFHVVSGTDTTVDAKTYNVQFADKADGTEWVRVRGTGHGTGANDDITGEINTAANSATEKIVVSADNAVKVFAGPRDDPFFFSLLGNGTTYKGFTTCTNAGGCFIGECDRSAGGTGCFSGGAAAPYPNDSVDTFAGFNVSSIVIEVPLADFTDNAHMGVWAATYVAP